MTIFNSHLKRLILRHCCHRFLVQGDNKLMKSLLSLFYFTRFSHLSHHQQFMHILKFSRSLACKKSCNILRYKHVSDKLNDSNPLYKSKLFRQIAVYNESNAVRILKSKPFSSPNKNTHTHTHTHTHTYIQALSRISSTFRKPWLQFCW